MHPPWITLQLLILIFVFTSLVLGDAGEKECGNITVSRLQRETYERERRLIPYMTYYITQNPTTANVARRQNILIPIPSSRENIFHLDAVPKIPLANIHSVNTQRIQVLPKPGIRLTNPSSLFAPTIQIGHYKAREEEAILPQIYRLEAGVIGPRIQTQVQSPQQIPSDTQPLHAIKVNPVPVDQKPDAPQIIKIVPFLTKPLLENRAPKSFTPHQLGFSKGKVQTYVAGPVLSRNENSFQENRAHAGNIPQRYSQLRLFGPTPIESQSDTNAYTVANIPVSTTTLSPVINEKEERPHKYENNVDEVTIAHLGQLNHALTEYEREPIPSAVPGLTSGKYAAVTPSLSQIYYAQKANGDQSEESQDSIEGPNIMQRPRLRVPQEEKIRFVASVTSLPITNDLDNAHGEEKREKVYDKQPPSNIFSLLKETNKLPSNLTPENIDAGIQTLALILERLQQQTNYQHGYKMPAQVTSTPETPTASFTQDRQNLKKVHSYPEKSGTSTPGRPGIDYPIYSSIPQTNFDCSTQRYKGFFGDPDTNCQVWHYCDLNGGQASFLCPNGTIFSQVALTCDWWFNVKCASTSQLYVLNERLYKYILPFSPSFPEDYSGPVVDTYLTAKFKEMEVKSKLKVLKSRANATSTSKPQNAKETPTEGPTELVEEYKTLRPEE